MLNQTAPHFLLLTQSQSNPDPTERGGVWRFVLEQLGSSNRIEVAEDEPGIWGERLQLLAVVRGLEALEQSAHVTLITPSRFVGYGIRRGLSLWRENGWQWENFGEMAPIKNCVLWKRIDQAMQYHVINCRIWDFDQPHDNLARSRRPAGRNRISFGEIQNARQLSFTGSAPFESADHAPQPRRSLEPQFAGSILHSGTSSFQTDNAKMNSVTVSNKLADKIKPIGCGRAFGYAPN